MDSDITGISQALKKSGQLVKSTHARLKQKKGRLRGNLMGKRIDFSAHMVITGDTNLGLDELNNMRRTSHTPNEVGRSAFSFRV